MQAEKLTLLKAYFELMAKERVCVWTICYRHAHGNVGLCRELAQEVFIRLWTSYRTLRPGAAEGESHEWVKLHAKSAVHEYLRKWRRGVFTESVDTAGNLPATDPAAEAAEQIEELTAMLPPAERDLVMLHLAGYSHSELAAMNDTTPNNVAVRLHRIIKKMRIIYNKLNNEQEK